MCVMLWDSFLLCDQVEIADQSAFTSQSCSGVEPVHILHGHDDAITCIEVLAVVASLVYCTILTAKVLLGL